MKNHNQYRITQIANEANLTVGELFDQLAARGITSPGEIAAELKVTPQAVRYQLDKLGYTVKNIRVTRVVEWSKSE
jgi:predicted ArsR family transcriptional regulator